ELSTIWRAGGPQRRLWEWRCSLVDKQNHPRPPRCANKPGCIQRFPAPPRQSQRRFSQQTLKENRSADIHRKPIGSSTRCTSAFDRPVRSVSTHGLPTQPFQVAVYFSYHAEGGLNCNTLLHPLEGHPPRAASAAA